MNPRTAPLLGLLGCILAFDAIAEATRAGQSTAPAVSRNWIRLQSENFTAEGTASAVALQRWLDDLEIFRSTLARMFPALDLRSPVPNRIVVVEGQRAMLDFAPLRDGRPDDRVGGYFLPLGDVNLMVAAHEGSPQATLYHEYTHFVLHNALPGPIPSWVDEGLAEFYGAFAIEPGRKRAILGRLSGRWGYLSGGVMLPLDRMITEEGAAEFRRNDVDGPHFYAQSWALVHYLSIGHGGKRDGQLTQYLLTTASGVPSETAFVQAFKTSPETLQNELRSYLSGLTLPGWTMEIVAPAKPVAPVERLFDWQAMLLRGRILSNLGRLAEADKLLQSARAAAPDRLEVLHAVAELRGHQGRAEEAVTILESFVDGPGMSLGPRLVYAQTLTAVGRHDDAVAQYERVAAQHSRLPKLWLGLSLSQVALGRQEAAQASMARLRAIDPDPWWWRSRMRMAWKFGLFELVLDDAVQYTSLEGFESESGMYSGFQGVLAGRRLGETTRVHLLLSGIERAVKPRTWPLQILGFLKGDIDAKTFIGRARGNGQLTEAHAYVGLLAVAASREQEGLTHLNWVAERGSTNYVEYQLVMDELRRLSSPKRRPAPAMMETR